MDLLSRHHRFGRWEELPIVKLKMTNSIEQKPAQRSLPTGKSEPVALDSVYLQSPKAAPANTEALQKAPSPFEATQFSEGIQNLRTLTPGAAPQPGAASAPEQLPSRKGTASTRHRSAATGPYVEYPPTILDRLVTFISNLIRKLEELFLGPRRQIAKKTRTQRSIPLALRLTAAVHELFEYLGIRRPYRKYRDDEEDQNDAN